MVGIRKIKNKARRKVLTCSEADSGSELGGEDSELDECFLSFLAAFFADLF